jgi:L-threonylcarbamoyladenylate synthase
MEEPAIKTEILPANIDKSMDKAISILKKGDVVSFPTDTVYGLGADAFNSKAVDLLFEKKDRDSSKAIPILIGDINDLAKVTLEINPTAKLLAKSFWPGALTIIVVRHPELPKNLSPLPTIGIRMPNHPVALRLLSQYGPIATTSANISGGANPNTAQDVFSQLGNHIPLIIDGGKTPGGIPSTVVDCTKEEPKILREGPISQQQILDCI